MGLSKKYPLIKINKTRVAEGLTIENNVDIKIDKLGAIIIKVFLVNGIDNVKYKNYSGTSDNRNKLILSVNYSFFKDNKEKLINIIESINNIIHNCDIENELINIRVSSKRLGTVFPPLNTIEISEELMLDKNLDENQNINLIDIKNGLIKTCCVKYNRELKGISIALNPSNREIFSEKDHVYIQKKSNIKFTNVNVQAVNQVLDEVINIPDNYKYWIEKHGGSRFELINEVTGASMDINVDKIKYSHGQEKNVIKLNYFQRLVLETDLPQKISEYRYDKFKLNLKEDEDKINLLKEYYEEEKALTNEILKSKKDVYNNKKTIKEILNKSGYPMLGLYAISRESNKKDKFIYRVIDKILDIIIGSNKIYLKCIRPYETDESSNVVRLSKSTLELLGIDETDNLIISYRNRKVKARALVINEIESIKETNIFQSESELNVCIGIPAYIRNQLGMNKISVCCNVERDKSYLFIKNLNIQFISIIATILAVKQTFSNNNKIVAMLLVMLLPFSVYIIFSVVRNRISSK